MYPEIHFRPAQSVHIQNFDLSTFGRDEDPRIEEHRKPTKSRDGGLTNLKWKSENLLSEEGEEKDLENANSGSSKSLHKSGSKGSLFSAQTFRFEDHLFKESRLSLKQKCDICNKRIHAFQKRIGCKQCDYLLHSRCFKHFSGAPCIQ